MPKKEYAWLSKETQWGIESDCMQRLYSGMAPYFRRGRLMVVFQGWFDVGDIESGPKSDIWGGAGVGMRTDRCLNFPA